MLNMVQLVICYPFLNSPRIADYIMKTPIWCTSTIITFVEKITFWKIPSILPDRCGIVKTWYEYLDESVGHRWKT